MGACDPHEGELTRRWVCTRRWRGRYTLHALYEQQRWELVPASSGYLASYKQGLSLLVDSLLVRHPSP